MISQKRNMSQQKKGKGFEFVRLIYNLRCTQTVAHTCYLLVHACMHKHAAIRCHSITQIKCTPQPRCYYVRHQVANISLAWPQLHTQSMTN